MEHSFRITRTTLADGRELIYYDDDPAYVSGQSTRELVDRRDLPACQPQSEMRRDPLTGAWYAYAAHRMNRTFMPPANENPLAPTRPGELPTEIPADDYNVVVFENRFPSLALNMADPAAVEGWEDGFSLSDRRGALGRCEVICFTPEVTQSFKDLSLSRVRTVIEAWAHRTAELSAVDGVEYVYPFENRGEEIGVTLQHPHGQIYAYPFVPPRAAEVARRVAEYREQGGVQGAQGAGLDAQQSAQQGSELGEQSCEQQGVQGSRGVLQGANLFDDLLAEEHRVGTRIISRGEFFTAFVPVAAKWPVELMLMPHRQIPSFAELQDAEKQELAQMYLDMLRRMDGFFEGVEKTPYIASWNQAPVSAPQDGRLYLQLFSMMRSPGRMKFLAGSESGMGAWISDTTPERIAARFRELGES